MIVNMTLGLVREGELQKGVYKLDFTCTVSVLADSFALQSLIHCTVHIPASLIHPTLLHKNTIVIIIVIHVVVVVIVIIIIIIIIIIIVFVVIVTTITISLLQLSPLDVWGGTAEWSERCASIPKITGSNPSGGSELTFCSDLLLTARGGRT
jgi:hypothetical protein